MTFQNRLKLALKQTDLTQRDIANLAGISGSAITQWKSGTVQRPDAMSITPVARILNVEMAWLIEGIGPMRPSQPQHQVASPPGYITMLIPDELAPTLEAWLAIFARRTASLSEMDSTETNTAAIKASETAMALIEKVQELDANGTLDPAMVNSLSSLLDSMATQIELRQEASSPRLSTPPSSKRKSTLDKFDAPLESMSAQQRNTLWKHAGISTVDSSDILPAVPDLEDPTPSYQVAQLSALLSPEDFLEPTPTPRKKKTPRTTKG